MSGTAFAAIGLALLAVALGALAFAYRRRWGDAKSSAAAADKRAAKSEAALASAPLGCLVIAPGGARDDFDRNPGPGRSVTLAVHSPRGAEPTPDPVRPARPSAEGGIDTYA